MKGGIDMPRDVIYAWIAAFNARDGEAVAALYHDDAVNYQIAAGEPAQGIVAIRESVVGFFEAFPDSYTRLENMLVDHDRVAIEWSGGGTWRGPFAGRKPNGRAFTLQGCGFFHVINGKIKTQHGYWDRATWFKQLGIPVSVQAG